MRIRHGPATVRGASKDGSIIPLALCAGKGGPICLESGDRLPFIPASTPRGRGAGLNARLCTHARLSSLPRPLSEGRAFCFLSSVQHRSLDHVLHCSWPCSCVHARAHLVQAKRRRRFSLPMTPASPCGSPDPHNESSLSCRVRRKRSSRSERARSSWGERDTMWTPR